MLHAVLMREIPPSARRSSRIRTAWFGYVRTYVGGKKQKEENEDEIKNRGVVVVVGRKIVRY